MSRLRTGRRHASGLVRESASATPTIALHIKGRVTFMRLMGFCGLKPQHSRYCQTERPEGLMPHSRSINSFTASWLHRKKFFFNCSWHLPQMIFCNACSCSALKLRRLPSFLPRASGLSTASPPSFTNRLRHVRQTNLDPLTRQVA